MTAAGAVARRLDTVILGAAITVLVATTVALFGCVAIEVTVRYVTGGNLGWPGELPSLLFPWMTMAGIVVAAQHGQHFLVEAGIRRLPPGALRWAAVAVQVISALGFLYLAWTGLTILEVTADELLPVTGIATSWSYLSIVVGFTLLAVTALTTLPRLLATGADPLRPRVPPPELEESIA